jgi:hypothetical protein
LQSKWVVEGPEADVGLVGDLGDASGFCAALLYTDWASGF